MVDDLELTDEMHDTINTFIQAMTVHLPDLTSFVVDAFWKLDKDQRKVLIASADFPSFKTGFLDP